MNGERTTLPHRLGIVYHSSDSTPVVHYDSCIEEFCVACLGFPSAWSITSLNKTRLSQKFQQNTRGGTRTLSLLLRRQAPYPLGHTGNRPDFFTEIPGRMNVFTSNSPYLHEKGMDHSGFSLGLKHLSFL